MNNNLLALLDYCLIPIISQMTQIEILTNYLKDKNKKISFYTLESKTSLDKMIVLNEKLNEKPDISGFILFSLTQFAYGSKMNIELIQKILKDNYEIYFYRENIHLKNLDDFDENFEKLKLFEHNNIRLINKIKSLVL